jgi:RluA family pseudouridine synthase
MGQSLFTVLNLAERVLYRDGLILVIDKPAGLPVHKGPKGGENLEDYLSSLQFGLPNPPALGHRLDKDTSGCLALGRQKEGLRRLGKLFETKRIDKVYHALVWGKMPTEHGIIDVPLRKQSTQKQGWWMETHCAGQPSVTEYQVLGTGFYEKRVVSWIAFTPKTGRTHQLRVHSAHLGCPIIGDRVYGNNDIVLPLSLHALSITIPLYPNKPPVMATTPLPHHILSIFNQCGFKV